MFGRFLTTVILALASRLLFALEYSLIDLGVIGGNTYTRIAISNSGIIVGTDSEGAYRWINGAVEQFSVDGADFGVPYDVNEAGDIAGYAVGNASIGMTIFGSTVKLRGGPYGGESFFHSINNARVCAGYFYRPVGQQKYMTAAVFAGRWIALTAPSNATHGSALAINSYGEVVGSVTLSSRSRAIYWPRCLALWWQGSISNYQLLPNPDFTNYPDNFATKINDSGDIIVSANDFIHNKTKTFLWRNSTYTELSTPTGLPLIVAGLNDEGACVGNGYQDGERDGSWIRYADGTYMSLTNYVRQKYGLDFSLATDINDKGQIVGLGFVDSQVRHYLLTPL